MARGINKVTLIGNLGGDPSFKTFSNGGSVTNISLATSEVWKKDGETKERTEWHNVVFHNGLAEVARVLIDQGFHAMPPTSLSRLMGKSFMRRPVALKIAFATAATAGILPASPMLFAPKGP